MRRKKLGKCVLFHQDNGHVHMSYIAMAAYNDNGLDLKEHPPYLPDLVPSNLVYFKYWKKPFLIDDGVIHAVDTFWTDKKRTSLKVALGPLNIPGKNVYSITCEKRPLSKRPKCFSRLIISSWSSSVLQNAPRGSILQYFRPSLSNHLSLRSLFCQFLSGVLHRFD